MLAPFVDPFFQPESFSPPLSLLGRNVEMQVIQMLLTTVSDNVSVGPRTLTISGEMGIGKTRLLAEICQHAKTNAFSVLEMRAYESHSSFPYFPFVEALRPVLRTATLEQLRFYTGLPGNTVEETPDIVSLAGTPLVTALARLFPELPARMHIQPFAEILSPDQEKFRLFDAIATLFERLAAERPLLLCVDNLQWADSASLELILYLTIRLRASRVALIGATRPMQSGQAIATDVEAQKASAAVSRVLGELMQQRMWFPLPLGPLDAAAMTEHLHALLPDGVLENVMQPLLMRAEGNPFFLEELVRGLTLSKQLQFRHGVWYLIQASTVKLPTNIITAVHQRLQGISPECLELLYTAALFGNNFPVDPLIQAMRKGEQGTRDADTTLLFDEAMRASLISQEIESTSEETLEIPDIVRYKFCQGIVQEVLQTEIPAHRLRSLHYAIGQALEHYYAHTASEHAAELATHYAASGDKAATLYWNLLAGEKAVLQQAHRKAISHFRMTLTLMEEGNTLPSTNAPLPTPIQLHLTIAELWFQLGEIEASARSFQQALELSTQQEDVAPLLTARINRGLADTYRIQAKYEQALAYLQIASAMFDENVQEQPWFFRQGRITHPEQVSSVEYILLLQSRATLDLLLNRSQEAEVALWDAHKLAIKIGDRGSQAFSLHLVGWIYGWGERIYDAIRLQQQAYDLYIALGDPFRATLGAQGLGIIYQALGEMDLARTYIQRGFTLARQYGVRRVIGWLYWNQGVMALHHGDWASSEEQLRLSLQEAQTEDNVRLKSVVIQAQAMLQFRRGLWQEAEQCFQDALQSATNTDWLASTVALYGHFLATTGHRAAAQVQLDRARELPEYAGFSGTFYIPFLAEGYLHQDTLELAQPYFERIQKLRGFLYYGLSVDRVLGKLAALNKDWDTAEQAFENGLQLCRRANNQPEIAAILYEQARMAVIRGEATQAVGALCAQARMLFLQYDMQRAVTLVDTLYEGVQKLEAIKAGEAQATASKEQAIATSGHVLQLKLSAREREVLQLVAEGCTDREVADALVLSPRTVNRHLSNIFVKLNVPGRAAAVAYAIRQRLV